MLIEWKNSQSNKGVSTSQHTKGVCDEVNDRTISGYRTRIFILSLQKINAKMSLTKRPIFSH